MKKLIAILSIAVIGFSFAPKAHAIGEPWEKGTLVVGAMFGYSPGFGATITGDMVLLDNLWIGHLTVGAQISFQSKPGSGADNVHKYNNFAADPRVTYGLNITNQFEVHIGANAGLGYNAEHPGHALSLSFGTLAGVRYFFTESFGLQAEVHFCPLTNYAYPPLFNAGIAFKF